jgi:hypothetical protein
LLVAPSALAVAVVSVVFGDGGRQPFTWFDCLKSLTALAIVVVTVPERYRPIRIGAGLGIVMVISAFVLPTPVGSNATRLSLIFALPVVAAFAQFRTRQLTALALAAVVALQLPVNPSTITSTGKISGYSSYYSPVAHEIESRGPLLGRVEVPELAGHWDAVYLARNVPLARGWLRQTDVRLNDAVFYAQKPTTISYRQFLSDNAVQYVAVPDAKLTSIGDLEADLIRTRLPYLSPVWRDQHWTLYQVLDYSAVIAAPGHVLSQTPDAVVVSSPGRQAMLVRLRWSDWLGLESADKGSCIEQDGLYVRLVTVLGGDYTFNSKFPLGTGHCPKR